MDINPEYIELNKKKLDSKELDYQGRTLMTPCYLKHLCRVHGLYTVPELNDKLFLHYQGCNPYIHACRDLIDNVPGLDQGLHGSAAWNPTRL